MSTDSGLSEITKIGNYAIPAFAAFVSAGLAVGQSQSAIPFALYTVVSAFIAYGHRLAYQRNQRKHGDDRNLPLGAIVVVFLLHAAVLGSLVFYLILVGEL